MRNVIIKSRTCRKCKAVEAYLNDHPRDDIEMLFAETEEGRDLAIKHRVKAAPTMLVLNDDGELVISLTGDQEIISYLEVDHEDDEELEPIDM